MNAQDYGPSHFKECGFLSAKFTCSVPSQNLKHPLMVLQPAAFVKKNRLIPRPVRRIPTKHLGAYDEVGKIPGSGKAFKTHK